MSQNGDVTTSQSNPDFSQNEHAGFSDYQRKTGERGPHLRHIVVSPFYANHQGFILRGNILASTTTTIRLRFLRGPISLGTWRRHRDKIVGGFSVEKSERSLVNQDHVENPQTKNYPVFRLEARQ